MARRSCRRCRATSTSRGSEPWPARSDDPITATVIQASLVAAADEMFAVLKKTAMSPIIYEVLDVGTGITDRMASW